mgnify:CR=1 FL=1
MKGWFLGLAPRERAVVVAGGGLLALVLVYLAAVEPAMQAYAARERRVESLESQLEWMQRAAAEVRSLRASGAAGVTGDSDRPPYLAVDAALRGSGLPQPDRLEPSGDDGARLEFEDVPFDPLVRILGRLRSEHGLVVARARVTRGEAGRVSARLTLERAR